MWLFLARGANSGVQTSETLIYVYERFLGKKQNGVTQVISRYHVVTK